MKKLATIGIVIIISLCILSLFLVNEITGLYRTLTFGFMLGSAVAYKTLLEKD